MENCSFDASGGRRTVDGQAGYAVNIQLGSLIPTFSHLLLNLEREGKLPPLNSYNVFLLFLLLPLNSILTVSLFHL